MNHSAFVQHPSLLKSQKYEKKNLTPNHSLRNTLTKNAAFHVPVHHRNPSVTQNIAKFFNKNTQLPVKNSIAPLKQNVMNATSPMIKKPFQSLYTSVKTQNQKVPTVEDQLIIPVQSWKQTLKSLKLKSPRSFKSVTYKKSIYWEFENAVQAYCFAFLDVIYQKQNKTFKQWVVKFLGSKLSFQKSEPEAFVQKLLTNQCSLKSIFVGYEKALQSKTTKQILLQYQIQTVLQIFVRKLLSIFKVLQSCHYTQLFDLNDPVEEFILAELFLNNQCKSRIQVDEDWYQREITVYGQKINIGMRGQKAYVRIL